MNPNSGALYLQPGLNPWLVVLLGSIAGLLIFALSNALYVLHMRHHRLIEKLAAPRAQRARMTITIGLIVFALLALSSMIPGPRLVEGTGWLYGANLFSVSSRTGFIASYPNTDREVRKGDPILQLIRDAGPEEIAATTYRRALLAQDLDFTRLEILRVDPLLLAAHATEKSQLEDLLERSRSLAEKKEQLLRGARREKLADQSQLDEVERDLQAARYELDQTESSFKAARTSFEITHRADAAGLFSKDEVNRREERVAVLRSRRAEVRQRVNLLTAEKNRLQTLTATSEETQTEHMKLRGTELEELDASIVSARERVQAAWQAIERDKVRAERQREHRLRQIKLQMAEHDELLNARRGALDVRAPWSGRVGFREPSPASARLGNRPLLVLYKPGSISVRINVAADRVGLESVDNVGTTLQALIPEAAGATFVGKITRGVRLPDGSGELQIAGDPPEAAIRELAMGSAVPVHVIVRRLNPLANTGIGWFWWLVFSLLLGVACDKAWRWWLQQHGRSLEAPQFPRPLALRLDWGGDPDEFLEYVVGVGILPRRLRRAVPPLESIDDRHIRREQTALTAAASKAQSSLL